MPWLSSRSVDKPLLDDVDMLQLHVFDDDRNITHMIVALLEINKQVPSAVLHLLFESGFNFLSQDRFGFSALNYAIAFVGWG